jgi:hypothetical protein
MVSKVIFPSRVRWDLQEAEEQQRVWQEQGREKRKKLVQRS